MHGLAQNVDHNASANAEVVNVYSPIVPVTVNGDPHKYASRFWINEFIHIETVALHLNLQGDSIRYNISTISNQSSVDKVVSFHLDSPEGGEVVHLTNVLVIPAIPARHPS